MAEITEYKPFAYIEDYFPTPGLTEYSNTATALTKTRNDCAFGNKGGDVTLSVDAGHFVSSLSVADANTQANAWLNANAQAFANNSGTCRLTAWRGTNPSCVVEPSTTLLPFNYMIVRYKWVLGAGQDFDTFTGFINTGTELDNKYMGYGHGFGDSLFNPTAPSEPYIIWAGDNTQSNGVESCLVNFSKMTTDHPTLNSIQIRMAGAWYGSVGTGNIDIEVTTYLGGTMSQSGFDFTNNGGTIVQQLNFSKNIPKPPTWTNDVNAVTNIGYITYNKNSSTGEIVITY